MTVTEKVPQQQKLQTALVHSYNPSLGVDEIVEILKQSVISVFRIEGDRADNVIGVEDVEFCSRIQEAIGQLSAEEKHRVYLVLDQGESEELGDNINLVQIGWSLDEAIIEKGVQWLAIKGITKAVREQVRVVGSNRSDFDAYNNLPPDPGRLKLEDYGLLSSSGEGYELWLTITKWIKGGENLAESLDKGEVPIQMYLEVLLKIGACVHSTHEEGMAFTDLKPPNVIIVNGNPIIIDPDTAKGFRSFLRVSRAGTKGFIAPEMSDPQSVPASQRKVSAATDAYAFGGHVLEMVGVDWLEWEQEENTSRQDVFLLPFQKQLALIGLNLRKHDPMERMSIPEAMERIRMLQEELRASGGEEAVNKNLELSRTLHDLRTTNDEKTLNIAIGLCNDLRKIVGDDPSLLTQLERLQFRKGTDNFTVPTVNLTTVLTREPLRGATAAELLSDIAGEQGMDKEASAWDALNERLLFTPETQEHMSDEDRDKHDAQINEQRRKIRRTVKRQFPSVYKAYTDCIDEPFNEQWIRRGATGTQQSEYQLDASILSDLSDEAKVRLMTFWYKYLENACALQKPGIIKFQNILKSAAVIRALHEVQKMVLPAHVELKCAQAWQQYRVYLQKQGKHDLEDMCTAEAESANERFLEYSDNALTPNDLELYADSGLEIPPWMLEQIENLPAFERSASLEVALYDIYMKSDYPKAEAHLYKASLMNSNDPKVNFLRAEHALTILERPDIPTFCNHMQRFLYYDTSSVRNFLLEHYHKLLDPSAVEEHREMIISFFETWKERDDTSMRTHFAYINACDVLGLRSAAAQARREVEDDYNRFIHEGGEIPPLHAETMQIAMQEIREQTSLEDACASTATNIEKVIQGGAANISLWDEDTKSLTLSGNPTDPSVDIINQILYTHTPHIDADKNIVHIPIFNGKDLVGILSVSCSSVDQSIEERIFLIAQHLGNTWGYIRQQEYLNEFAVMEKTYIGAIGSDISPLAGVESAIKMVPERKTGGDFFDVIRRPNGNMVFVIGDVSGHGIPQSFDATLYRKAARTVLKKDQDCDKSVAEVAMDQCKIIDHVLGEFTGDNTAGDFYATELIFEIDPQNRTLSYVAMGHDPLVIIADGNVHQTPLRKEDEVTIPIQTFGLNGYPIRLVDNQDLSVTIIDIDELCNDLGTSEFQLMFSTDGMFEGTNTVDGTTVLGKNRLHEIYAENSSLPLQEQPAAIFASVESETTEVNDDRTVGTLKIYVDELGKEPETLDELYEV